MLHAYERRRRKRGLMPPADRRRRLSSSAHYLQTVTKKKEKQLGACARPRNGQLTPDTDATHPHTLRLPLVLVVLLRADDAILVREQEQQRSMQREVDEVVVWVERHSPPGVE